MVRPLVVAQAEMLVQPQPLPLKWEHSSVAERSAVNRIVAGSIPAVPSRRDKPMAGDGIRLEIGRGESP